MTTPEITSILDVDAGESPITRKSAGWLWPLLILGGLSTLGLAGYILDELREGDTFRSDSAILLAFRHPGHLGVPIGPAWLLQSAIDLSARGGFTLMWLLGGASLMFLAYIGRRSEAVWLGASIVGASVINALLKIMLHRPRPEVVPHLAAVSNASFPSGHAMISTAVYLTLGIMLAETQARTTARTFVISFAGLLVFLIGCSRIYLGVHWPSDVLAGCASERSGPWPCSPPIASCTAPPCGNEDVDHPSRRRVARRRRVSFRSATSGPDDPGEEEVPQRLQA